MIGNVDSKAADCIAVAARRPGRQELEVGDAAERGRVARRRRSVPSPRPIAARNRTGDRNELNDRSRGTSAGT